ncbi:MAG: amidohydrolase family protein [Gemmatimonadota bacterium]
MSKRSWILAAILASVALLVLGWGFLNTPEPPDLTAGNADYEEVIAFTDVHVIPMDQERVLRNQTVVVGDGRIVLIGPADATQLPPEATIVEGGGRYLLPGLAEMHAHVPPSEDPPREELEEILFLFVANGVTTIRGMLGAPYQLELREEIRRGETLGPDFYVGAPSINGNTAPTPAAVDSLVRAHQADGYDLLKIHPGVSLEVWNRMVEVAREVGITYSGHVPTDVGIHHAIETGMSTVDHFDGFLQATRAAGVGPDASGTKLYRATDREALQALVEKAAEHRVWQVPTQYLWNHLNGTVDPDEILALEEFRYIPPQLRESYRERAENNRNNPEITPESHEAHAEMRQEFLAAAHRAGVPILMGTDSPQLFNVPGFAIHREIPLMEDAGMSRYDVLLSGTRLVAEYVEEELGLEGDFGTVEAGKRANLILVERNPLEDLGALQERVGVMVGGVWLPRAEIDARLAAIAARYASDP